MTTDPHALLRDDVSLLGEILGETLRGTGGDRLFDQVERIRAAAKDGRDGGAPAIRRLQTLLEGASSGDAVAIARAFSHFLTLANIAEQYHRVRRRRDHERDADGAPQADSFADVLNRLAAQGLSSDAVHDLVTSLRVELVITAHPTEIARRTLTHKHLRIADALERLDTVRLTPAERQQTVDTLRGAIAEMWDTEDVRQAPPAAMDEVASGLLIFEQTLWDAVPAVIRRLDSALLRHAGRRVPHGWSPLRFGSWIGGDRDGNPAVTADVTRGACLAARALAARLYAREIDTLQFELSMRTASDALRSHLRERFGSDEPSEPYRALLRPLRDALLQIVADPAAPDVDVAAPLEMVYRSLIETGQDIVGDGRTLDLLRRTAAFGTTLVRLDVRQHAARHAAAMTIATQSLGLGDYQLWDEAARLAFLTRALREDLRPGDLRDAEGTADVFGALKTMATLPAASLGAYVISMTEHASDVLAVAWLQQLHGCAMRISPLFEEVETLHRAGDVVGSLLALPEYRGWMERIGSPAAQEIMIGYSDSAKDGGRLAANWELYRAQEAVVRACRDAGVEPTLFHGRGGSIGRGGGPIQLAFQTQPPGSVDGRLRVTVQGEIIQGQFGLPGIASRSLELYLTATLGVSQPASTPVPAAWTSVMDDLAKTAHDVYRQVVYDHPRFVEYFRAATPEHELGFVPIGSRPARRGTEGGVESLRAIPWVFAWTQTRLLLPAWLGTAEALGGAIERGHLEELRQMARDWPFFRSTLRLVEIALAEAEPEIAAAYDTALVASDLQPLGDDLRQRLARARERVLEVLEQSALLEQTPVLRRSIDLRNPYVDPINLVQVQLLREMRQGEPDDALIRAFRVAVNGIAAGMRNVG